MSPSIRSFLVVLAATVACALGHRAQAAAPLRNAPSIVTDPQRLDASALLLAAPGAVHADKSQVPAKRPNIILILADDKY